MRTGGQGGRFDANDKQDNQMLHQLKTDCTEAVLTEGVGIKAPMGWDIRGQETKRLWDKKFWKHQHSDIVEIRTPGWVRGTKEMDHFPLEYSALHHSDVTLLLGGGHFPAHLIKPTQRRANETAIRGLNSAILRLKDEYKPTVMTFFFDVNRDMRLDKNVRLMTQAVRGTGLRIMLLPKPDFRGRKISLFLTSGKNPHTEMLNRVPGYDHRGGLLKTTAKVSRRRNG